MYRGPWCVPPGASATSKPADQPTTRSELASDSANTLHKEHVHVPCSAERGRSDHVHGTFVCPYIESATTYAAPFHTRASGRVSRYKGEVRARDSGPRVPRMGERAYGDEHAANRLSIDKKSTKCIPTAKWRSAWPTGDVVEATRATARCRRRAWWWQVRATLSIRVNVTDAPHSRASVAHQF